MENTTSTRATAKKAMPMLVSPVTANSCGTTPAATVRVATAPSTKEMTLGVPRLSSARAACTLLDGRAAGLFRSEQLRHHAGGHGEGSHRAEHKGDDAGRAEAVLSQGGLHLARRACGWTVQIGTVAAPRRRPR